VKPHVVGLAVLLGGLRGMIPAPVHVVPVLPVWPYDGVLNNIESLSEPSKIRNQAGRHWAEPVSGPQSRGRPKFPY
jgi:hypothetical protein